MARAKGCEGRRVSVWGVVDRALVALDTAGLISGWSFEAEALFGWSLEDALGCPIAQLTLAERCRASYERQLGRLLKGGEGEVVDRRIELLAVRRDGGEFPVELSVSPLRAGEVVFFVATLRDLSGRREPER